LPKVDEFFRMSTLAFSCSYGITDLRTKSQIYPQVIDVCSSGGQLIGEDVSMGVEGTQWPMLATVV
jgi:hypothetical protein